MTTRAAARTPAPAYPVGLQQPASLGMLLLILTEGIFFGLLFTSYFYLRSGATAWPQGDIKPSDLRIPSIETVLLLSSSLPIIFADERIRRGDVRAMRLGYAMTFMLGTAFLGLLGYEFHSLEFRAHDNAYASLFILIIAFHGTHVFVGLLMNAFTQLRAALGHFDAQHHLAVQNASWYWHFVDIVWIFIFLILYLSPHWYEFGHG